MAQTIIATWSVTYCIPFYQRNDRIGFVDVRGMLRKSPVKEFNLGGGYRWLSEDSEQFYGAYGFYDRKLSQKLAMV